MNFTATLRIALLALRINKLRSALTMLVAAPAYLETGALRHDDAMRAPSHAFRAPPPPALDSPQYAEEVNHLKAIGGKVSTLRTAEQTLIAKFWADFSYTSSPPGHWNEITREICRQRNLPLAETARLFALLNVTLADTCITIWDSKYHYNYWRPVTAIHVTQATRDKLAAEFTLEDRGTTEIKGRGPMHTWLLRGKAAQDQAA